MDDCCSFTQWISYHHSSYHHRSPCLDLLDDLWWYKLGLPRCPSESWQMMWVYWRRFKKSLGRSMVLKWQSQGWPSLEGVKPLAGSIWAICLRRGSQCGLVSGRGSGWRRMEASYFSELLIIIVISPEAVCGNDYPLVVTNMAMENHHVFWDNTWFPWPFSMIGGSSVKWGLLKDRSFRPRCPWPTGWLLKTSGSL